MAYTVTNPNGSTSSYSSLNSAIFGSASSGGQITSTPSSSSGGSSSSSSSSSGGGGGSSSSSSSSGSSSSSVNSQYQQYFGRNATQGELDFWTTQPISGLQSELSNTYQQTSGTSYDGSPIDPGQTQTANQIAMDNVPEAAKATLYGPNGQTKIVEVGTVEASQLQSEGWGLTSGSYVAPQTETNTDTQNGEVNPEVAYAVDSLYQKYFGRPVSATEQTYWITRPIEELDIYLNQEYSKPVEKGGSGHEYDGSPIEPNSPNNQTANDINHDESTTDALAIIDQAIADETIPADVGELFKFAVENYPTGLQFDVDTLLETFNSIKDSTIDDHFEEITNMTIKEIQNTKNTMLEKRSLQLQSEGMNADEAFKQARTNLEARGMTFSGEAVSQIGQKSAIANQQIEGTGTIGQANQLIADSSSADYNSGLAELGTESEKLLGSEGAADLGLDTIGDITGTIQEDKDAAEGSTLSGLIDQQITINGLNTNL